MKLSVASLLLLPLFAHAGAPPPFTIESALASIANAFLRQQLKP